MAPPTNSDLPVILLEGEREGHHTFGVIYDGAFVPIAQHKSGHVQAAIARFEELELPIAKSPADLRADELEEKVAELTAYVGRVEKSQAKLREELTAPAKPAAKTPPGKSSGS